MAIRAMTAHRDGKEEIKTRIAKASKEVRWPFLETTLLVAAIGMCMIPCADASTRALRFSSATYQDGGAARNGSSSQYTTSSSSVSTFSSAGACTSAPSAADIKKLTQKYESQGFDVSLGTFSFFDIARCEDIGTCFFQNPTTPYGIVSAATGNEDLPDIVTENGDGANDFGIFHLRQDEAVVAFGCTPPDASYFSIQHYIFTRNEKNPFGSIGNSFNSFETAQNGKQPFQNRFAWVMSGNEVSAGAALSPFDASSWLTHNAFIPGDGEIDGDFDPYHARFGSDASDDTFLGLMRIALPSDPAAFQAYMASPPVAVLRLTPRMEKTPALFPQPTLTPRAALNTEVTTANLDAIKTLVPRVTAAFKAQLGDDYQVKVLPPKTFVGLFTYGADWGGDCVTKGLPCFGDIRDTIYGLQARPFKLGPDDVMVAVGVNHAAFGDAVYSNIGIWDATQLVGLVAPTSEAYAGSADAYLKGTAYGSTSGNFYVQPFSRNCGTLQSSGSCADVPTAPQDPYPSADLDSPLLVLERAYINPLTGVGQSSDSFQFATLVLFQKGQGAKLKRQWKRRPTVSTSGNAGQQFPAMTQPSAGTQTRMGSSRPGRA